MDHAQFIQEGHEVMGEDYCSGYMDSFGKWNNGFPCPAQESGIPVLCCGTESVRYCCVRPKTPVSPPVSQLTLLLSISFAIAVTLIIFIIVSCFHCTCCLLYKKRQPATATSSVYQMHCPSNASGVANMYSLSGMTTPADTPRTVSRASSSRSRLTTDSTDLTCTDSSRGFFSVLSDSRPSSIAYSDRTSSTVSEATVREIPPSLVGRGRFPGALRLQYHPYEPPPPYSAPNSTLVAVRTSTSMAPLSNSSHSEISPASVINNRTLITSETPSSAQMRTFTQSPSSSGVLSTVNQPCNAGTSARLSAMRLNQQLNSLANLRQGYTNHISSVHGYLNDEYDGSSNGDIPQPMNLITPSVFASRESSGTNILSSHGQRIDENRLYTATKF